MPKLLTLLISSLLLSLMIGCSDSEDSPQAQVQGFIDKVEVAAESRQLSDIKSLLSEQYKDEYHNDRQAVVRILAGYFFRHKNINLFTRTTSLNIVSDNRAEATVLTAMTAQRISNIDALVGISGQFYRFDIVVIKHKGDWLLNNARWKRIKLQEFMNPTE